ncbi:MAG: acetyl-CoA C-acetyltransferase [Proteobacteria bacterium]|nr:acetyl-CoA C-acetyltransferase [Pseudomonadota bacterium]MDA0993970.1 acetyl-CoA C-acetyltransferase [Pseudomonadota bacterium]
MTDAFIYDHVRSPRGRGRSNGSLHEVTPIDLASQVLASLRDRNNLDTSKLDDVIMGCVSPVGEQGSVIPRTAVLNAGYDQRVPGKQLNRYCASGLEAVNTAAAQIMSGQSDLTIGGGIECMSRVPMGSDSGAMHADPAIAYRLYFAPQGIGADLIASLNGFKRKDVDAYAVESQKRAAHAWESGYFKNSVVPIKDHIGMTLLDKDEHMRPGTSMEDLAGLKAAFSVMGDQAGFDAVALQKYPQLEAIDHVHTGGNSSGIVDGCAAMLLGNKEMGDSLGLKPRAKIVGFSSIGSDPTIMLTGPTPSAEKVLKRCGMTTADIDLFELNEAFASVVMLFMKNLEIPHDKINVNGGAIAMGHPLGATGTMILGTVLDELERRDLNTALINLCIGGGMGTATIIERV